MPIWLFFSYSQSIPPSFCSESCLSYHYYIFLAELLSTAQLFVNSNVTAIPNGSAIFNIEFWFDSSLFKILSLIFPDKFSFFPFGFLWGFPIGFQSLKEICCNCTIFLSPCIYKFKYFHRPLTYPNNKYVNISLFQFFII